MSYTWWRPSYPWVPRNENNVRVVFWDRMLYRIVYWHMRRFWPHWQCPSTEWKVWSIQVSKFCDVHTKGHTIPTVRFIDSSRSWAQGVLVHHDHLLLWGAVYTSDSHRAQHQKESRSKVGFILVKLLLFWWEVCIFNCSRIFGNCESKGYNWN